MMIGNVETFDLSTWNATTEEALVHALHEALRELLRELRHERRRDHPDAVWICPRLYREVGERYPVPPSKLKWYEMPREAREWAHYRHPWHSFTERTFQRELLRRR